MPAAVVPVPVTSSSLPPHHFPLTVSYGCVPRSRFIRLRKLPSEAVRHTSPVQIFPCVPFPFLPLSVAVLYCVYSSLITRASIFFSNALAISGSVSSCPMRKYLTSKRTIPAKSAHSSFQSTNPFCKTATTQCLYILQPCNVQDRISVYSALLRSSLIPALLYPVPSTMRC